MTADKGREGPEQSGEEINKYRKLLDRDPNSRAFAPLAEAYRKAGLLDEAVATAREGLNSHPGYFSGRVALGRALYAKGEYAEARGEFSQVVQAAPDNLMAHKLLGKIHLHLQNREEAEKSYRMVLLLDPGDEEAKRFVEGGEPPEAEPPSPPAEEPPVAEAVPAEEPAAAIPSVAEEAPVVKEAYAGLSTEPVFDLSAMEASAAEDEVAEDEPSAEADSPFEMFTKEPVAAPPAVPETDTPTEASGVGEEAMEIFDEEDLADGSEEPTVFDLAEEEMGPTLGPGDDAGFGEEADLFGEAPVVEEPPAAEEYTTFEEPTVAEEIASAFEPEVPEEVAITEEPPVFEEAPVVEEPPAAEEFTAFEEPAVAEEVASAIEPEVLEEAAITEEPPVFEETPVVEEPPAAEGFTAFEDPSVAEEFLTAAAPEVLEEAAIAEEFPPAVEPEVLEEAAIIEEPPAVEEAPIVEETPNLEDDVPVAELDLEAFGDIGSTPAVEETVAAAAGPGEEIATVDLADRVDKGPPPDEGGVFDTETLADLYINQGFYGKAAGVYRRILQDNPEDNRMRQKLEEVLALERMEGPGAASLPEEPAVQPLAAAVPPPPEPAIAAEELSAPPHREEGENPTVRELRRLLVKLKERPR